MARTHDQWTALGNGPLRQIADNAWCVEVALPDMPLKRLFTIARRDDGQLVFHNPAALDEARMAEVDRLGRPAALIVPNGWHRLDVNAFRKRYPDAKVHCPAGARKRVEEVTPVDGTYDDYPADGAVRLQHLDGVANREGYLEITSPDGVSLAFNDAIFNMPHLPGFFGFVYRVLGSTGGPKVTRLFRLTTLKDKRALRAHIERLAETPRLRRVLIMHGESVFDAPGDFLRTVAQTL